MRPLLDPEALVTSAPKFHHAWLVGNLWIFPEEFLPRRIITDEIRGINIAAIDPIRARFAGAGPPSAHSLSHSVGQIG